ncbi:unnamed protein product [Clonostachys solani]|uniref:Uncharacterized protein n=1 Tax=Clonostachys solani TaxID=160281 RepID=A0A9N9ZEH3_9HYPO|nr:unnamed protein product [Clonostachys solani]
MEMFSARMSSNGQDGSAGESTYSFGRANKRPNNGIIRLRGRSVEVLEQHVGNVHLRRELLTTSGVLLSIALIDLDGAIVVDVAESVIRDIAYVSRAAATSKTRLEISLRPGPDLESGAIGSIAQSDIVDVQILNDVEILGVLAQRADRDAV